LVTAGLSAGIDQWKDKPEDWEQAASGYGKRFSNILGQYSIQRTVTFGLASALHEDIRYFNSGETGIWSRNGYAITSGILARGRQWKPAFVGFADRWRRGGLFSPAFGKLPARPLPEMVL